jgi:hypothetical protein
MNHEKTLPVKSEKRHPPEFASAFLCAIIHTTGEYFAIRSGKVSGSIKDRAGKFQEAP